MKIRTHYPHSPDRLAVDGSIGWSDISMRRPNQPEFDKMHSFHGRDDAPTSSRPRETITAVSAAALKETYADGSMRVHRSFAAGPRDCVGKTLTYTEMRLNVAKTILYSDVQLLPGQEHWASKQRIIVLQKGPVDGQVDAGV
ncbi:hypothetical protein MGG_12520 [Pyricularia oryzae 70-15]|uniref:Uncharacterized protein n=1 Tax=Pyricularia oryzae (strain 70-15 / ATCC MYA-4617 / FGSC 8958) TaxID=242507 RepID=G4NKI3_PYRO7|nr:uncharacterized protein MGG_12520 [Pyricularia oryzae 70-15]EHA45858.1 hypothetical protein MGG_12520 [Pyricularia oryzae 70-15]KAI7916772.1 hypothetical protein M9X92_007725 [Pyricularia oryzae]KAI7922797.1 hypothetical protein M0657_005416 [Pyricularia oryzae]